MFYETLDSNYQIGDDHFHQFKKISCIYVFYDLEHY